MKFWYFLLAVALFASHYLVFEAGRIVGALEVRATQSTDSIEGEGR